MFPKRKLGRVLPVAVAGSLAFVGVNAGPASGTDASAPGSCVTGGTGTILMWGSFINHMLAGRISITALGTVSTETTTKYDPLSVNSEYTVTNYRTTGGDANEGTGKGHVQYSGGILIMNTFTGRKLVFGDIKYDATNNQIDYTLKAATVDNPGGIPDGGIPVGFVAPIFNMTGEMRTDAGNTQLFVSRSLLLTAEAAQAMNGYFHTDLFKAGDNFGPGFRSTYVTGPCA